MENVFIKFLFHIHKVEVYLVHFDFLLYNSGKVFPYNNVSNCFNVFKNKVYSYNQHFRCRLLYISYIFKLINIFSVQLDGNMEKAIKLQKSLADHSSKCFLFGMNSYGNMMVPT